MAAENGRQAMKLVNTGSGHVTGFGTLEEFLNINRAHLAEISATAPGQSDSKLQ